MGVAPSSGMTVRGRWGDTYTFGRDPEHFAAFTTITVVEMDSQTKELSEFCGVLWREREVVERVLFKVLGQQLVLKSRQTRW